MMTTESHENLISKVIAASAGLTKPLLCKQFFEKNCITIAHIEEAIREFAKDKSQIKKNQLRVFTKGRNMELEERLLDEAPSLDQNLESWCRDIFDEETFGIILNKVEIWSENLACFTAKFAQPVIRFLGFSNCHVESVLFIGNYGYSPFGIHQDEGDITIFHIHLGPSPKEMLLWSPEDFNTANGSLRKNFRPHEIRETSQCFNEEKGDLFVLPGNYYHVGNTKGFCITLAITITKESKESYTDNALKTYLPELKSVDSKEVITVQEWLNKALNCYSINRKSNCYLVGSPKKNENVVSIEDVIKLKFPFQMDYFKSNTLEVCVRGYTLYFDLHAESDYCMKISAIIDLINENKEIEVRDLVNYSAAVMDKDAILFILTLILQHHGIQTI